MIVVYDCEIKYGIVGRGEKKKNGIIYCKGWTDFVGMGISCICAYDYETDRYRVFCDDNYDKFQDLIHKRSVIIGYNNHNFDDRLCEAHNIHIPKEKSYDLLVEIWRAVGLGPKFNFKTHGGYGLDAVIKENRPSFGGKTDSGHKAPEYYQEGKWGKLIDYCVADVFLTREIVDMVITGGGIRDPKRKGNFIRVASP